MWRHAASVTDCCGLVSVVAAAHRCVVEAHVLFVVTSRDFLTSLLGCMFRPNWSSSGSFHKMYRSHCRDAVQIFRNTLNIIDVKLF
jgi:hypothetical protein